MAFGATLRSYFQLLGALFLTTQTLWMVLSIVIGIILTIFTFLWQITTTIIGFLFSYAFIVFALWLYLFSSYKNSQIQTKLLSISNDNILLKIFPCEKCKKLDSEYFFSQCCHAFHLKCVDNIDVYIHTKTCPQCHTSSKKSKKNVSLILSIFKNINKSNLVVLKLVVYGAALYGIYLYGTEHLDIGQLLGEMIAKKQ